MKNTEWIGNTISILFFAVLAIASWGLSEVLQRGRGNTDTIVRSGPNAIIDNPTILRTDALGHPLHRLQAKRILHDERGDQSVLEQPVMTSLASDKPKIVARANTATTRNQQNQIDLTGEVIITRDPFAGQPPVRITTSKATLLISEEKAMTDAPVLVQRGLSTLQGVGLRFDQKTQQIDIVSESRMVVPKEAKQP
jgi:lipopolysaccharide export system protein LptC